MKLFNHANQEVQRHATGAMRNLIYDNAENKLALVEENGIFELLRTLREQDDELRKNVTGACAGPPPAACGPPPAPSPCSPTPVPSLSLVPDCPCGRCPAPRAVSPGPAAALGPCRSHASRPQWALGWVSP